MKQMNKPLTLEERKSIQLDMLKEIDAFCRKHEIKYSLAFGTLLGAIRHKGFIPWDDDVDIMMPLPDLLRFKKEFKSDNIEYYDVDNDKYHNFAFSLFKHKLTYSRAGLVYRGGGIGIDLYVCIGVPDDREGFIEKAKPLYNDRIKAIKNRIRAISYLPIKTIPFFSSKQKKYRNYLFDNSVPYQKANYYYIIAGPLRDWRIMSYDYDLFDELIDVKFENIECLITSHYDQFLTLRYGDYMTPPPIEQQRPAHGGKYYWKNKH